MRWRTGYLITLVSAMAFCAAAYGDSTGVIYPTAVAVGEVSAVGTAWGDTANALGAPDGAVTGSLGTGTASLDFSSVPFAIPSGSTIDGIQITLRAREMNLFLNNNANIKVYMTDGAGSVLSPPKNVGGFATTLLNFVLGGPTDTWGVAPHILTADNLNLGGGLSLIGTSTTISQLSIDSVGVEVFFTPPDTTPPEVVAIAPAGFSKGLPGDFNVTFSEDVTGVDETDFALTVTGSITGASVTSVSGSGANYVVTVDTGSGVGTIRLDVLDDDSIEDLAGNPLGGAGAGNGAFTSGIALFSDSIPPEVSATFPAGTSKGLPADFNVSFSEDVTGVDETDFALTVTGGITGASVTSVSGSGANYVVTADTGSGFGTVRLDVVDDDSILDLYGNPLGGVGVGNGDFTTGTPLGTAPLLPAASLMGLFGLGLVLAAGGGFVVLHARRERSVRP